ncbi:hypothetical protein, partial [Deinococcus misasensis]|uniref:hypothetical protein n=1 Tax=Deinococcus misasensis TaxID=392413 RepID=UPI000553404D
NSPSHKEGFFFAIPHPEQIMPQACVSTPTTRAGSQVRVLQGLPICFLAFELNKKGAPIKGLLLKIDAVQTTRIT